MKLTDLSVPKLEGWINITEAGRRLGLSRQWVYKQAAQGVYTTLRQVGDQPVFVVQESEIEEILRTRDQGLAKAS